MAMAATSSYSRIYEYDYFPYADYTNVWCDFFEQREENKRQIGRKLENEIFKKYKMSQISFK